MSFFLISPMDASIMCAFPSISYAHSWINWNNLVIVTEHERLLKPWLLYLWKMQHSIWVAGWFLCTESNGVIWQRRNWYHPSPCLQWRWVQYTEQLLASIATAYEAKRSKASKLTSYSRDTKRARQAWTLGTGTLVGVAWPIFIVPQLGLHVKILVNYVIRGNGDLILLCWC